MIDYTGVFIGRFQPFHNGHACVLDFALAQFPKIIIVIGSSFGPRTERNPFTFSEREKLIRSYLSAKGDFDQDRVAIVGVPDHPSNDVKWLTEVHVAVENNLVEGLPPALVGRKKDRSGYYLDLFPNWKSVAAPSAVNLDATTIREMMYTFKKQKEIAELIPEACRSYFSHLASTPWIYALTEEIATTNKFKSQFSGLKYAPVHVTVDAVVVRTGHVLMVVRGARPGKGLLALPGGFFDAADDVSLLEASVRELFEETRIDVPRKVVRGSVVGSHVFDGMNRSSRGRTITHAFHFDLGVGPFPSVKGSDEAQLASWVPLSELSKNGVRESIFEDHLDIISHFTGI